MHFTTWATIILAAAGRAVRGQAVDPDPTFDAITKPGLDENVPAGKTYTVEWIVPDTAPAGPVTLTLLGGKDGGSLNPLGDIGKAIENSASKFDWAVDPSVGSFATYGLRISLDADPEKRFQFSTPFHITGLDEGNTTSSSTAGSNSGSTSTTASKGSKSTSNGSETTSPPATATTTETEAPSTSSAPSGTTTAPPTETNGSGASGGGSNAAGLLGGLALAVLAL